MTPSIKLQILLPYAPDVLKESWEAKNAKEAAVEFLATWEALSTANREQLEQGKGTSGITPGTGSGVKVKSALKKKVEVHLGVGGAVWKNPNVTKVLKLWTYGYLKPQVSEKLELGGPGGGVNPKGTSAIWGEAFQADPLGTFYREKIRKGEVINGYFETQSSSSVEAAGYLLFGLVEFEEGLPASVTAQQAIQRSAVI